MSVSITSALSQQLNQANVDPVAFAQQFALWKADWPKNEYAFELFGKDGAYRAPKVDGSMDVLRHVHIMPVPGSNQHTGWLRAFRFLSRKTSDRHLVYVQDAHRGFLLIYILDEPTAHAVARMQTREDKELMEKFAIIAENYIIDGDVP